MAHLRSLKIQIKSWLSAPDWRSHLPEIVSQGMSSMGPLMGLLMYEPQMRLRAAIAIGAVTAEPQYGNEVRPLLLKGLADTDMACRGYAAWALGKLGPDLNDGPALRHASEEGNSAVCLIVDGDTAKEYPASELARMALGNR